MTRSERIEQLLHYFINEMGDEMFEQVSVLDMITALMRAYTSEVME